MSETYLTLMELQARLRVSRATVFRWLTQGMPSVGTGRTRRFAWSEVVAWRRGQWEAAREPLLPPGRYRCVCGWIGGISRAARLSEVGPCRRCGTRGRITAVSGG